MSEYFSDIVVSGTDAEAEQYNDLRKDALYNTRVGSRLWFNLDINPPDHIIWTQRGRMMFIPNTTSWDVYDALYEEAIIPRNTTSIVSGLTITPDVSCRVENGSGTEYILAFATGGTTPYRYDSNGQNETSCTFSGTTITTGAERIGYDPLTGYIYIMDDSSRTGTTIKRYTLSGTVLTYVDTITLDTAPSGIGHILMWIGKNYLVLLEGTTGDKDIVRYNKDTGAKIDAINDSVIRGQGGFTPHPQTNDAYLCTVHSNDPTSNPPKNFMLCNYDDRI